MKLKRDTVMKKLLVIFCAILSFSAMGQTRKVSTMVSNGDTAAIGTLTNDAYIRVHTVDGTPSTEAYRFGPIESMLSDSLGWFNVLSYGAVADGSTDNSTAFQEAIDAAAAYANNQYGGATVYVPNVDGKYLVDAPIEMKTGVTFKAEQGTFFYVDGSPPEYIWEYESPCYYSVIDGGFWDLEQWDVDFIRDSSLLVGHNKYYNRVQNVTVDNCESFLDLYTADGVGWNGNIFHNILVHGFVEFIHVRNSGGTYSGFDGNRISTVQLQADSHTKSVLDTLDAIGNYFDLICWDLGSPNPDGIFVVFTQEATRNIVIGWELGNFGWEDKGRDNLVISDGQISSGNTLMVRQNSGTNENAASFYLRKAALGETNIPANSFMGYITWQGYYDGSYYDAATITSRVRGTPGANDMGGNIEFFTSEDGTATPVKRLYIDDQGGIVFQPIQSVDAIEGSIYYDSDDNHFYGYNGSAWVQLDN
jgi:hypothetical protein